MYNSHKANGWCNNHSQKYFGANQLSKTVPFIECPQAITYQLSNRHSTQYINYRCKIIYFTVVICVYFIVLYLFCIKRLLSNLTLFHFQTEYSDTHVYAHSWSLNDGDRNQQINPLLGLFLSYCNMFLYWIAIPFIGVKFFCYQSLFQACHFYTLQI